MKNVGLKSLTFVSSSQDQKKHFPKCKYFTQIQLIFCLAFYSVGKISNAVVLLNKKNSLNNVAQFCFGSVNETEVCTITAITDRKTITVSPALTYRHLGETYTVGTKTFDMRAEVGLLTRNIKIIGNFVY